MKIRKYTLRPLVVTVLIFCCCRVVEPNKYKVDNSKRRTSSRRRSSRQPLDTYNNEEPPDSFRQSYRTESIRNYDDNIENYEQNYDNYNNDDEREPTVAYVQEDLVNQYTKKFPSKIMVSVCSG